LNHNPLEYARPRPADRRPWWQMFAFSLILPALGVVGVLVVAVLVSHGQLLEHPFARVALLCCCLPLVLILAPVVPDANSFDALFVVALQLLLFGLLVDWCRWISRRRRYKWEGAGGFDIVVPGRADLHFQPMASGDEPEVPSGNAPGAATQRPINRAPTRLSRLFYATVAVAVLTVIVGIFGFATRTPQGHLLIHATEVLVIVMIGMLVATVCSYMS
jgi:hypothetical protein